MKLAVSVENRDYDSGIINSYFYMYEVREESVFCA
jgi:hypothetical protein